MPEKSSLCLVVLRVTDTHRSAEFYSALGVRFQREQHGSGAEHFAATFGETVFELYPASERFPVTSTRLGFKVASIDDVLRVWRQSGAAVLSEPGETPWGTRAVVEDPDGHRIELVQRARPEVS